MEETGIEATFGSIVGFTTKHPFQFGKSNLYFVCRLTPLSERICIQDTDEIVEQVDAVIESVMTVGRWLPWCHSSYSVKDAAEWFVICEQSMSANISYDLGIFDKSIGELVSSIAINY